MAKNSSLFSSSLAGDWDSRVRRDGGEHKFAGGLLRLPQSVLGGIYYSPLIQLGGCTPLQVSSTFPFSDCHKKFARLLPAPARSSRSLGGSPMVSNVTKIEIKNLFFSLYKLVQ